MATQDKVYPYLDDPILNLESTFSEELNEVKNNMFQLG